MNRNWIGEFGKIITRLESCMVSADGFSALLGKAIQSPSSPISAVQLSVRINDSQPIDLGSAFASDPYHQTTIPFNGGRHPNAILRLWIHDTAESLEHGLVEEVVGQIRQAFNVWWTPDSRSPKADLPLWTEATKRRGQGALLLQKSVGGPFTVIFCDLDNFKLVNNKLGQEGGDVVINKMATFFETTIGNDAVLLHHGGDEFVIVLPDKGEHEAIELAARIVDSARIFDFGTGDIPIGFSFGITSAAGYPSANFEELTKAADEKSLKDLVKADPQVKGSMRVSGNYVGTSKWGRLISPNILALMLRCSLERSSNIPIFASAWLNALVKAGRKEYLKTKNFNSVGEVILNTYRAFRISLGTTDVSYLPGNSNTFIEPQMSGLDVAAAFARVILEAYLTDYEIIANSHIIIRRIESETTLSLGDDILMNVKGALCEPLEVDLGVPWQVSKTVREGGSDSPVNSSSFILMEIGRNNLLALSKLAADHIVIDDRPVCGGGLPDFWELSLSRLISSLWKFPNVEKVIVVGQLKNAEQTVAKLITDTNTWDVDYISYKTAVPKILVQRAQERLSGKVALFTTEEDAIESLITIACAPKELHAAESIVETEPRTLIPRKLDYPNAVLGPADGCRVRTAAEAYPLMLEMLRVDNGVTDLIVDQDGVQLRELVDFKVVVEDVAREQIPWFFRNEESALDTYFERQFINKDGRFARELQRAEFEARILKHVSWALTRTDGEPFATRRALLVIPHEPVAIPHEVAPLGLISVRIMPRPTSTETVVNFSFTWRTVEAVIGFPYSLYGSLRYSQHLYAQLCSLCPTTRFRLGYVSYVAHSLHFFVSDESRRIARRIVSESSS